jgi:putative flippase GtrA
MNRKNTAKKKASKQKENKLRRYAVQVGEYMVTGGVWFWSGYFIIITLDDHIGLFWANMIGNTVGITLNFVLERYWVFRTKKQPKLGLIAGRYIAYTILNAYLLNYFILYGLSQNGIKPEIGQFIASGFFTVWNYFWYKYWVFNAKATHKAPKRSRHHA